MKKLAVSLDGGGIRGTIQAFILTHLENKFGGALPISYVGGTSTGAIVAAGLSLDIPADDLLSFYLKDGPRIFGKPSLKYKIKSLVGLKGAKYDAQVFQDILEENYGNKLMTDSHIPLLCTAYNISTGEPKLFTSRETPHISIVDAVLASATAPTYFKPKLIAGDDYIDGGMFASNPSLAVFTKAKEMYHILAEDLKLLSIGTCGVTQAFEDMDKAWKYKWIQPLINIMMSSDNEYTHSMIESLYESVNKEDNYLRLNVHMPSYYKAGMDDASQTNLSYLIEFARYVIKTNNKPIDKFLETLKN